MTDICSVWAYHEIVGSGRVGKLQAQVLSIFSEAYPRAVYANELLEEMRKRFDPSVMQHSVAPRISELVHMGLLEAKGMKESEITNKTVNVWAWTGNKNPKIKMMRLCRCKHCDGRGSLMKQVWDFPEPQKDLFENDSKIKKEAKDYFQ